MQTFYEGHVVLEMVNQTGNDKVYVMYMVKDQTPTDQTYRIYAKYGKRNASELQVASKRLGIPNKDVAVTLLEADIAKKIQEGYVRIHAEGIFKGKYGATEVPSPNQVPTAPLNPVISGSIDDRRGLVSQDGASFANIASETFDWDTRKPVMTVAAPTPTPSRAPVAAHGKNRAQIVVERTQTAISQAKEMIRDLCKDLPSPFSDQHPLIQESNRHIWSGVKEIQQMAYLWERNARVLSVGPAGCGKTAMFKDFASTIRRPFVRINLNGHVTPSELIGKYIAKGGETIWIDGTVPTCMKNGYILLIDEVDMAESAVLALLHPVLEPDGALILKEHDSEVIFPHPEFRLFATANSLGTHDDQGIYTGTNCMNAAFLDRWEILEADYLTAEGETAVLCMEGHPYSVAEALANGAAEVRKAIKNGDITGVLSTRRLMSLAHAFRKFDNFEWALEVTVKGQYTKAEAGVVSSTMQRFLRSQYSSMSIA